MGTQRYAQQNTVGYPCQGCKAGVLRSAAGWMTSFPIDEVWECPICNTRHFLLFDKTLCTESEYNARISKHYRL